MVAVGETGLDRHWNYTPFPQQEDYFARHLELARKHQRAVVIHCREAEADVVRMLRDDYDRNGPVRAVMHSFTGDAATAAACLEMGLFISFAGMVTYKNAQALARCGEGGPFRPSAGGDRQSRTWPRSRCAAAAMNRDSWCIPLVVWRPYTASSRQPSRRKRPAMLAHCSASKLPGGNRLVSFLATELSAGPASARIPSRAVVQSIAATTTKTGLEVHAWLDEGTYPKGRKVSDEELEACNIKRNTFHGEWNYEIHPH